MPRYLQKTPAVLSIFRHHQYIYHIDKYQNVRKPNSQEYVRLGFYLLKT